MANLSIYVKSIHGLCFSCLKYWRLRSKASISRRVGIDGPATHQPITNLEDVAIFLLGGGFNPFGSNIGQIE